MPSLLRKPICTTMDDCRFNAHICRRRRWFVFYFIIFLKLVIRMRLCVKCTSASEFLLSFCRRVSKRLPFKIHRTFGIILTWTKSQPSRTMMEIVLKSRKFVARLPFTLRRAIVSKQNIRIYHDIKSCDGPKGTNSKYHVDSFLSNFCSLLKYYA